MATPPQTLPADFFSQPPSAQKPPDTLPADFFSKSPAPVAAPAQQDQPGFWSRLGESLNPVNLIGSLGAIPSVDPMAAALGVGRGVNLGGLASPTNRDEVATPLEAVQDVVPGAADIASGNYPGAAGAITGFLALAALGKYGPRAMDIVKNGAAAGREAVGLARDVMGSMEPGDLAGIAKDVVGMVSPRAAHGINLARRGVNAAGRLQNVLDAFNERRALAKSQQSAAEQRARGRVPLWADAANAEPQPVSGPIEDLVQNPLGTFDAGAEAPAAVPPSLPSGRKPGGYPANAPAAPPAPPRTPLWSRLPEREIATTPQSATAAPADALPSGRKPGGYRGDEPAATRPPIDTAELDATARNLGGKNFASLPENVQQAILRAYQQQPQPALPAAPTATAAPTAPAAVDTSLPPPPETPGKTIGQLLDEELERRRAAAPDPAQEFIRDDQAALDAFRAQQQQPPPSTPAPPDIQQTLQDALAARARTATPAPAQSVAPVAPESQPVPVSREAQVAQLSQQLNDSLGQQPIDWEARARAQKAAEFAKHLHDAGAQSADVEQAIPLDAFWNEAARSLNGNGASKNWNLPSPETRQAIVGEMRKLEASQPSATVPESNEVPAAVEQPQAPPVLTATGNVGRYRAMLSKVPGAEYRADQNAWVLPDTPENRLRLSKLKGVGVEPGLAPSVADAQAGQPAVSPPEPTPSLPESAQQPESIVVPTTNGNGALSAVEPAQDIARLLNSRGIPASDAAMMSPGQWGDLTQKLGRPDLTPAQMKYAVQEMQRLEKAGPLMRELSDAVNQSNGTPAAVAAESTTPKSGAQATSEKLNAQLQQSRNGKAPLIAKDPATMTPSEINKNLDRIDKLDSALTREFIAAGRGDETPSQTWKLNDPLAERSKALYEARAKLRNEIELRYGPGSPSRLPRGFNARVK